MEDETFSSVRLIEGQNSFFAFVKKLTFIREEERGFWFLCHSLGGMKTGSNVIFSSAWRKTVKKKRKKICLSNLVRAAARVVRAGALVDSGG